jgi:hypothetical protein
MRSFETVIGPVFSDMPYSSRICARFETQDESERTLDSVVGLIHNNGSSSEQKQQMDVTLIPSDPKYSRVSRVIGAAPVYLLRGTYMQQIDPQTGAN